MNKKMKWIGILVLAASLLLTACGAQPTEAVPTSTPEPTATAEPVSQPVEKSTGIVNMAEEGKTLYAAQLDR